MANIKILSLATVGPNNVTVQEYQTATFTVSVSGATDPITYQWERSLDGGITWELTTRTGSTISMVGLMSKSGRQFRAVITSGDGTKITSAPAILTVTEEVNLPGVCEPGPQKSRHIYTLDFGTCVGEYKLYYDMNPCNNEVRAPSRIQVIWDDQTFDTGFRGNIFFNQQLNDLGFPNITNSSNAGMKTHLVINKDMPTPTTGKVIIDTPFQDSGVEMVLECPEICELDSDSDIGSDIGSDSDSDNAVPRDLCFAPNPCPIIAATDYLETPGPGDDRNKVVGGQEFVTKIQIPVWVAGLNGPQDEFTNVTLKGLPIDIENIGVADTIVKRLDTVTGLAVADTQGYSLDIPEIDAEPNHNTTRLEIVGLSLKSVEPVVADDGSEYDMYVGLRSYLDPDDEESVSKGAMNLAYEVAPEPGSGRPGQYLSGIWSSRFMMKVACVLVPAGSLADFEPTKNEDGTWNPPLKKPLDPDTGLADPKGLVHRLVKISADSGYDQGASTQSIRILEDGVEPLPVSEPPSIAVDKLFDCQNSGFTKDPEAPQIEPDNPGAVAFAPDKLGNSEPAATGNIGVASEVTSPHDAGCKDGSETCADRVTHGVAGVPNRTMCEGPDCGGTTPGSVGNV